MTTSNEQEIRLEMTETSDFYNACAANDIPRIKFHLAHMSSNEINRVEPNGSTALHVACYHHNAGAVYLLLRFGAIGSIKNRHGLTAFEETTSLRIKQLFLGTGHASWIEWTFLDPPTREMKQMFDFALKSAFHTWGLSFILDYLHIYYARRHVSKALSTSMEKLEHLESLMDPFRTSFWLNDKRWFVTCAYVPKGSTIWLHTTPIRDSGIEKLVRCEVSWIDKQCRLTQRSIDEIIDNTDDVTLTILNLKDNQIGHEGAKRLAEALRNNTVIILLCLVRLSYLHCNT
ncbi:unnamed protein product [Adineta steineri]|uniref:Uncharacterized protein n=1 Tax=Adineta steineri TaxID=433720 RepID=A0A814L6Q1_9BILA|nr:unnamed protein product [Adineta steineri]